ncbi:MAG: ferrous iron transport protein B [Chthoniobacter sp.]|uniref:ferrous iron transport protein B n=1 Tax=Chthoniobacter sp. TaxID=2510640 RepID=UPI0032A8583F
MSTSILEPAPAAACAACSTYRAARLKKLGLDLQASDFVIALAGNPNTGKSTVFNALTGLRQHTGNWPGKTVARAEGGYEFGGKRFKLVDLPGTYSLMAGSPDEEIARDFILFGEPEVTVVVVDASRLERNLNLALQVLEITDRVVVCFNLIDEARRRGLEVDTRCLSRDLGVPVVATSARFGEGMPELLQAIDDVAAGRFVCQPHRLENQPQDLKSAIATVASQLLAVHPGLPNGRWVAMQLLDGDESIAAALRSGELGQMERVEVPTATDSTANTTVIDAPPSVEAIEKILQTADSLRRQVGTQFHERIVEAIYADAARLADRAVTRPGAKQYFDFDRTIDRVVTSRVWGFPVMVLLFALMFWLTISGANVPSRWLAALLLDTVYPMLQHFTAQMGWPWWLRGLTVDGMYLATAWVVSVMLPPMAIFFPLFTLLEDLGYLPRVAFNMDGLFKKAGAHGKQAMTMMMGFGCNAAGVVATRIIDSPRERLIAIITNNFSLCNGRWPTQILIAALFIGALVPAPAAGLISALAVMSVAGLGVVLTFVASWALSRTALKGEPSIFSLELPPYRPPRILQTIYTSLIERTLIVLWRAVVFALPAGAVIWLSANVHFGGVSVAEYVIHFLNPLGVLIGLNGVILLAYIIAIPANEIVIPVVLMMTVLITKTAGLGRGAGVMFEMQSHPQLLSLLHAGGWTLLTAVNLMLFSLVHNPCSTTIYTIYKETRSAKWTAMAALMPLALGFVLTFAVAQVWRLFVH